MEAPKDKRTKAYKEWLKAHEEDNSVGLGDTIEKVTKATGIKKAVDYIFDKAGKDCGCEKRKEKLNSIRFVSKPVRCFTEEQYNQWTEFRKSKNGNVKQGVVTKDWQRKVMIPIYAQLFAIQHKPKGCCIENLILDIDKVYEQYQ